MRPSSGDAGADAGEAGVAGVVTGDAAATVAGAGSAAALAGVPDFRLASKSEMSSFF